MVTGLGVCTGRTLVGGGVPGVERADARAISASHKHYILILLLSFDAICTYIHFL
jgi:hypothetical protein